MKNFEKYKMVDERLAEFEKYCSSHKKCKGCRLINFESVTVASCAFAWLDLDAEEEKPIDCPFCGSPIRPNCGHLMMDSIRYWVDCTNPSCMYRSGHYFSAAEAVSAHNRICRAVKAHGEEVAK